MAHTKPSIITRIQRGRPISNGLVRAWPMNFQSTGLAGGLYEVASGGNVETQNNAAAVSFAAGPFGTVIKGSGATDAYATIAGNFDQDQQGTFAAWIRQDSALPANQTSSSIQMQGTSGSWTYPGQVVFGLADATGTERLRVYSRPGNNASSAIVDQVAVNSPGIVGNGWFHVAVVSDGTAWTIYKNAVSQSLTVITGSNSGAWFGDQNETSYSFIVLVVRGMQQDDVRYYNRALSQPEIAAIYAGFG